MRSRAKLNILPALLVMVALLTLATPASQAQGSPAPGASTAPVVQVQGSDQTESLSSVPEIRADQHVEHIPYDTPFHRFRVYKGGMNCQANVRFWVQDGVQVTTMKMVGTECYRQRIRVNFGNGYERPLSDYHSGNKLRVETSVDFPFLTVLYGLCVVHTESQERVCSLLERAPAWTAKPIYTNSSSLPKGGGGLFRL